MVFARVAPHFKFTSVTRLIVAINFFSLVILLGGILYLSDFRDRLIDARGKSLEIEAGIIAKALALEGTANPSPIMDDVILGQAPDNVYGFSLQTSAELLRSLVKTTKTRGYLYSADGTWLVDSNRIYKSGRLTQYQNPTERRDEVKWIYKLWLQAEWLLRGESLPQISSVSFQNGKNIPEVEAAIEQGSSIRIARENELGETVLNYAAPIEKGGRVLGALLLTTQEGEIDELLANERLSLLQVWALAVLVTFIVYLLLARTIAGPMRRLARSAEGVRRNIETRASIPDYSHRPDEIGYLAHALREMTNALYARLDTIENFAADVSHELKNPLTSMQSAVETLPLAKKPEDRERLMEVIRHDVRRMNRLITDISDASRLDAELAREGQTPVNVVSVLDSVCAVQQDVHRDCPVRFDFQIKGVPKAVAMSPRSPFKVYGHEGRLSQVVSNLLDNAISFSPKNGKIRILCSLMRKSKEIEIAIEDEGRGIPEENLEKIFERFYTDRPEHEEFGKNSGLGLNISRQIVTAHKGRIWAENRTLPSSPQKQADGEKVQVIGARFIIRLPIKSRDS